MTTQSLILPKFLLRNQTKECIERTYRVEPVVSNRRAVDDIKTAWQKAFTPAWMTVSPQTHRWAPSSVPFSLYTVVYHRDPGHLCTTGWRRGGGGWLLRWGSHDPTHPLFLWRSISSPQEWLGWLIIHRHSLTPEDGSCLAWEMVPRKWLT